MHRFIFSLYMSTAVCGSGSCYCGHTRSANMYVLVCSTCDGVDEFGTVWFFDTPPPSEQKSKNNGRMRNIG